MFPDNSACLAVFAAGFMLCAAGRAAFGQDASAPKPSPAAPLLALLDRFTAADVPALGPAETPLGPHEWAHKPTPAGLPGKGIAEHPMLFVGEIYNKMFIVNNGKVIWTYATGIGPEYDDAWMLSNGNILFSRMQYVAEVTPKKEVVWRYDAPAGCEIHCCQPIGPDKVLFNQNGTPAKLMVVNIKTKAVEYQRELPAPAPVHTQFRRVRYTAKGTYLVPYLNWDKVVEYDHDFKEVWSYAIKSPWAAVRLKNGNTLITDEVDKLTVEVNPKGEIVWQLKPDDLPAEYRFIDTQTSTRLANGNTIVCSRGYGKGPQLVEVTPDKKVVWVLWDWANLGPATAVQILDEPGIPEYPGDLER